MSIAKLLKNPHFWLFTILILGVGFLINSVDVDSLSAQTQVVGEGTPHFLAKWVGTAPPPGSFNLSSGSVTCNSVPLSWTASSNANGYRILRGSSRVDISPYQPYTALNFTDTTVSQNTTYQYQIEAYNSGGTNRSNEIKITTPYCPPTLSFSSSATNIFQGQSVTLSWRTSYVTSCTASSNPTKSDWNGSKALNGNQVVVPLPPPSVTYNLQCFGPGGSVTQSVTINISPLLLPEWREIIPR